MSGARDWLERRLTNAVITTGYLYGHLYRFVLFRWLARSRLVRIGPFVFRVPVSWEDHFEPTPDGEYILRNIPVRYATGDRWWYRTAVELRIRRPDGIPLPSTAPMRETCRYFRHGDEGAILSVRVANGVDPALRKRAERVLFSARIAPGSPRLEWPKRGTEISNGDGELIDDRPRRRGIPVPGIGIES